MADEYPFWARWTRNRVVAADITSVDYDLTVYNPSTDVFDSVETGTINSADATGKWIVPFTIPNTPGLLKYLIHFVPNGGNHPNLIDEVSALDGQTIGGPGNRGNGTETHSGTVCDRLGNPLEGVAVRAVPYGTLFTYTDDTTNASGEYNLTGLHANHAYQIEFNKDGFWAKQSGIVVP